MHMLSTSSHDNTQSLTLQNSSVLDSLFLLRAPSWNSPMQRPAVTRFFIQSFPADSPIRCLPGLVRSSVPFSNSRDQCSTPGFNNQMNGILFYLKHNHRKPRKPAYENLRQLSRSLKALPCNWPIQSPDVNSLFPSRLSPRFGV